MNKRIILAIALALGVSVGTIRPDGEWISKETKDMLTSKRVLIGGGLATLVIGAYLYNQYQAQQEQAAKEEAEERKQEEREAADKRKREQAAANKRKRERAARAAAAQRNNNRRRGGCRRCR